MYPRIVIDMKKLLENARSVFSMCEDNHIHHAIVVVKVLAGNRYVTEAIAQVGFPYLADSRLENLKKYQTIPIKKVLLRLPSSDTIHQVVQYADMSLNSELETIIQLNEAAKIQHKIHDILLMFDLGDLREGIFFQDSYLAIVQKIIALQHIRLIGIGTNLTCYGGVIPTHEILMKLVKIKDKIESTFPIHLEIISGGNSSSFYLLETKEIPKAINSLRFGEIIFMGRETAFGTIFNGLHPDVFTLQAQIIEIKTKPSYPIGEIGLNSFGEKPIIEDRGIMKRGILAIGKQDVMIENLTPMDPSVQIIGASSDHLIVDLTNTSYQLGQVIDFSVNYPGLLHLMNSSYVKKSYIHKKKS